MSKIIIDNREPKDIIDYIKANSNKDTEIVIRPMDVGDYAIYDNDNDKLSNTKVIFERKSLNDLVASIKDGRYNEQSARLNSVSLHNHNIIYIIEGDITRYKDEKTQKTIYSSLFSMLYYKGFSIINSLNKIQTAEYILHFFDKYCREKSKRNPFYNIYTEQTNKTQDLENDNEKLEIEDKEDKEDKKLEKRTGSNYCSVIKTTKKANITKDNILQIMLMQIPSISEKCAESITSQFPNLETLLDVLRNEPDRLNELRLLDTNRKISKTVRENLIKFLL